MTTPVPSHESGGHEPLHDLDLAFAEPDSIDGLRSYHREWMQGFRDYKVAGLGDNPDQAAIDAAHQEADSEMKADIEADYQSHINRSTDKMPGELRSRLDGFLPQFAYNKMGDEEWNDGLVNSTTGDREPSGRKRLQDELDAIRTEYGTATPDDPADPTPPPAGEGLTDEIMRDLNTARDRLALASYERRQLIRKNGRKARDAEKAYNDAKTLYDAANLRAGEAQARHWRSSGLDDTQVLGRVVHELLSEHQIFSHREQHFMEHDNKLRSRVARFLARNHNLMIASGVTGVVVGGAVKWAMRGLGLAGAATGVLLPAAAGGAMAVASTRYVLSATVGNRAENIRHFEQRRDNDIDELQEHAGNLRLTPQTEPAARESAHTALITRAHDLLTGIIDRRVETDRQFNLRRVGKAALIGAAGGLLGVGLETFVAPHVIGLFHHPGGHAPGSGNTTPTPAKPNPIAPPTHPTNPNHLIDGYQPNIKVPQGAGYEQMFTNLAAEKGLHLSGAQSWALYEHMNSVYNGHFFTNIPSYHMANPGEWGISHPGIAHWDPHVIEEMNSWLNQQGLETPATKAAKLVGQGVGKKTLSLAS